MKLLLHSLFIHRKVFCIPHNSIIMSVENCQTFPCLLLISATTLYVVNTSADTVEHSYHCVHYDLRVSSEEWEWPKGIDINSDNTVLLTLVSRQQLFIDISSEQRVQTIYSWLRRVVMVKAVWLPR